MSTVLLCSFEEPERRGGRGYPDSDSALLVGSSILGSIEREVDSGDATTSVNMNNVDA